MGDKPGFFQYVHDEIAQMLVPGKKPAPAESSPAAPTIPVPSGDSAERGPGEGAFAAPRSRIDEYFVPRTL